MHNHHNDTHQLIKDVRTIDGTGNNLTDPSLNAANTDFNRLGVANFADGVSTLVQGPSPRDISNVVVGQGDAGVTNAEGLSDFMYAWGQFMDHDLDLQSVAGTAHIDVNIPVGDPSFPNGATIGLTRAVIDPTTGAGTGTPATAINNVTGWLDASMVYGSDQATANGLRLPNGHLRTDGHNNLPSVDGLFQAGDVRAQENPALTALQTLFMREHNYQVDQLHKEHPHWTGDQLYTQARAIVGAEIAHITYAEFLPHLLGSSAPGRYQGYDPTVDPRITEEFAGAAFRFGHSIVSGDTGRIDNNGEETGPALDLKDTFFMTAADFNSDGGADGFLRHLGSESSQAMDARIVDDLRNFLVDPPAAIDLASINIERGRDLGLPLLNQMRTELGLAAYTDFSQITTDQATAAALQQAFGTIDKVDLWTGGLSESHVNGGMVGDTFNHIIAHQFEVLRDGDRLWYQNQDFDQKTMHEIQHTTLSDIIERDTDTHIMQPDAFVTTSRHGSDVESEDPTAPQLVIEQRGKTTAAGGPGADQFVFETSGIRATIEDFTPGQDKLVIDHSLLVQFSAAFDDGKHGMFQSDDHGNTKIKFGGDTVTLVGVSPHDLSRHDFIIS